MKKLEKQKAKNKPTENKIIIKVKSEIIKLGNIKQNLKTISKSGRLG